jgi:hypothetical protein
MKLVIKKNLAKTLWEAKKIARRLLRTPIPLLSAMRIGRISHGQSARTNTRTLGVNANPRMEPVIQKNLAKLCWDIASMTNTTLLPLPLRLLLPLASVEVVIAGAATKIAIAQNICAKNWQTYAK